MFSDIEVAAACPVCGSNHLTRAFTPDVVRCLDCGVFFRSPRPTQADIKKSYDSGSTYESWTAQENERRERWHWRLDRLRPYVSSGNLLDVGTGDGHFLDVAREAGFQVEATELSDTGIERARQRGFSVHKGQMLDIDFQGRRFDAITIWHVLEHVPNPGEMLREIYSLLKPGGILAVAVPNEENKLLRHRLGLRTESNPLGSLDWGKEIHLTHFQPWTLRRNLQKVGFEILDFGVDDIYLVRSGRNRLVLAAQCFLSRLTGYHFSMAMYCICRRPLT